MGRCGCGIYRWEGLEEFVGEGVVEGGARRVLRVWLEGGARRVC